MVMNQWTMDNGQWTFYRDNNVPSATTEQASKDGSKQQVATMIGTRTFRAEST